MTSRWTLWQWTVFVSLILFGLISLAQCADAVECFPSLEAAKAAHPRAAHYAWSGPKKHRGYYVGWPGQRCDPERQVMRNDRTGIAPTAKPLATRPLPSKTGGAAAELTYWNIQPIQSVEANHSIRDWQEMERTAEVEWMRTPKFQDIGLEVWRRVEQAAAEARKFRMWAAVTIAGR